MRDPTNLKIRYICQKDYIENDDGTHYGTMFDKQFGIPVYSAYTLTEDNVDFKEWARPKWKQTERKLIYYIGLVLALSAPSQKQVQFCFE